MTGKQRSYLKKMAHSMKPVIQVGKEGVSPNLILQVRETIHKRELIKISFLESCPDEVKVAADKIVERAKVEFVQLIGRKLTVYKRNPENPTIELP